MDRLSHLQLFVSEILLLPWTLRHRNSCAKVQSSDTNFGLRFTCFINNRAAGSVSMVLPAVMTTCSLQFGRRNVILQCQGENRIVHNEPGLAAIDPFWPKPAIQELGTIDI